MIKFHDKLPKEKKTKKSVSAVQATASVPLLSDAGYNHYNLVAARGDLGTRIVLRTTRVDLYGH